MTETPREVYLRFLDLVGRDRWSELADLYAEDAVVEQPYARPEPRRILRPGGAAGTVRDRGRAADPAAPGRRRRPRDR
jgi:hypothetical protein